MRILIAEDETDILELYKSALQQRGHVVVAASNGEEALRAYEESLSVDDSGKRHLSNFAVVVLDFKMPKKDGMEVAESILKLTPGQRIIFASAYVKDTLLRSVKKLNRAVELIQKPFQLRTLVDTIEDLEMYAMLHEFNANNIRKTSRLNDEQLIDLTEQVYEIIKTRISS
jgi:CheY-like chemotaxis protein